MRPQLATAIQNHISYSKGVIDMPSHVKSVLVQHHKLQMCVEGLYNHNLYTLDSEGERESQEDRLNLMEDKGPDPNIWTESPTARRPRWWREDLSEKERTRRRN